MVRIDQICKKACTLLHLLPAFPKRQKLKHLIAFAIRTFMEAEKEQFLIAPDLKNDFSLMKNNRKTSSVHTYIHTFSLILLTIQQTVQPLLVRKAHHEADKARTAVVSSTIVLVTELIRLFLCCFHVLSNQKSFKSFGKKLLGAFLDNKKETIKVCIPALTYVIQNNLYFLALKLLDATLFSITYQLRILTTAILMVIILRKVFSITQWGALFVSFVGVICVQVSSRKNTENADSTGNADQVFAIGIVLIMCWMSSFAGVYLEGVFKNSKCDIWLQNIRLSVITLPFAVLTIIHDLDDLSKKGFFYGWTNLVWIISFSSAFNGVIVSVVMKYADNVKKSYCQSIALGGTAIISIFTGDTKASILLFIGVGLVIASVFLYSLFPPSQEFDVQSTSAINVKRTSQDSTENLNQSENNESLTLA